MALKIGIIGPSNLEKISKLTAKPVEFFIQRAGEIGGIIAKAGCDLWINADAGMTILIAKAYKENQGENLTILFPVKGEPWPLDHIHEFKRYADHIKEEPNWFWANYNVVSQPDLCLCVGLSAGTLSELAYIKWDHKLKCGRLKKLLAIRELLRGGSLPPEIEVDIKEKLVYLDTTKDLELFLKP